MMGESHFVVMTTINKPTRNVSQFQALGYPVVVVGDKKTPKDWFFPGADYLDPESQLSFQPDLAMRLPWNHYCRKNIGYLYASSNGADAIIDTDDDNFPGGDYSWPNHNDVYRTVDSKGGYLNPYAYFTKQKIWPRGYPLDRILEESQNTEEIKNVHVGVWQGLADGDPDVDAIYRLTIGKECVFEKSEPIVLKSGTFAPFNSQNTWVSKELFPLLYLPSTVSFRFTDILRGIVAQPIMWCVGLSLGFSKATVLQERNIHDYLKDFQDEVPMYSFTSEALEIAKRSCSTTDSSSQNLRNIYIGLYDHGIVSENEIDIVDLWLEAISGSGLNY